VFVAPFAVGKEHARIDAGSHPLVDSAAEAGLEFVVHPFREHDASDRQRVGRADAILRPGAALVVKQHVNLRSARSLELGYVVDDWPRRREHEIGARHEHIREAWDTPKPHRRSSTRRRPPGRTPDEIRRSGRGARNETGRATADTRP